MAYPDATSDDRDDGRRASHIPLQERASRPHRRERHRAADRARYAGPPPPARPAGGRAGLLRRGRAPQRRAAALRPDRDHGRPGVLSLPAAPGHRLPAARPPAVRDRGAHLGGVPDRAVHRDAGPARAAQRVDLDRDRLAGRTDRLEPGRRSGAGRGHVPRRARGAVGGRAGREREAAARLRGALLDRSARLARGRSVRGVDGRARRAAVRPRADARPSPSSGSPIWRRSGPSRTCRCTASHRSCGRRPSCCSSGWRFATRRPGRAGLWRSRRPCWSARVS